MIFKLDTGTFVISFCKLESAETFQKQMGGVLTVEIVK